MVQITGSSYSLAALALQKPAHYKSLAEAVEVQRDETAKNPKVKKTDYAGLFQSSLNVPKLEKHIDDYHDGRGYLSKKIAIDIERKQQSAADGLSLLQPAALNAYQGYLTSLNYGARARFIQGVDRAVTTSTKILGTL